jgi:hypothetical protein
MDEDRGGLTRACGALGREDTREERILEEVRREIRREVATAIQEEVAHAVELGGKDNWERLKRLLIQHEEEEKKRRMAVDRRLGALEQAFWVGPVSPGESGEDLGECCEPTCCTTEPRRLHIGRQERSG